MLKGIVTYKDEVISLEGLGDKKRSVAVRAYEYGFVLGINENGKTVFYAPMAGELEWISDKNQATHSTADDPANNAETSTPKQKPDNVSASNPDPGPGTEPEKPELEGTPEPGREPEKQQKPTEGSGITN